jgi:hypothetical protein
MGGSVSFRDNVPHGTVMTLRIPQQQASAAAAATAPTSAAATTAAETAAAAAAASSRAQFELLLQSKRILVSSVFLVCLTCSALLSSLKHSAADCKCTHLMFALMLLLF